MLEEQKNETLDRVLKLISSIHNMTNADDYETILNEANYYVMVDKQPSYTDKQPFSVLYATFNLLIYFKLLIFK